MRKSFCEYLANVTFPMLCLVFLFYTVMSGHIFKFIEAFKDTWLSMLVNIPEKYHFCISIMMYFVIVGSGIAWVYMRIREQEPEVSVDKEGRVHKEDL